MATEEKRRRLIIAKRLSDAGEQGRVLAWRAYAAHMDWWLRDVMCAPLSIEPHPQQCGALADEVEAIAKWNRLHKMAHDAQDDEMRWKVAYAVVHGWLYRPNSVTPILRGLTEVQWGQVEYIIRTLPPWARPDGFEPDEHITRDVIYNPEHGGIITRPSMSLAAFIRESWHILEPITELSWSWHLDRMCETAELTSKGMERDVAINVPPGSMKSLTFAVFWPAWEWTFNPSIKWLTASHSTKLAMRDNIKCGRLITSSWYQERFGRVLGEIRTLGAGQIVMECGGGREITSPKSSATGWRGDRLLCDDLISVSKSFSRAERDHSNAWFKSEFSNRRNDMKRSSLTLIAQRTHELDVFAQIMSDKTYAWVIFPTRFKPGRFAENHHDQRRFLFEDERLVDGDLLHPERFGEAEDAAEQVKIGPVAYASQHDQEPRSDGGGLVHYEWMEAASYTDVPRAPGRFVQVWDLRNGGDVLKASTSFAVGQLWFKPDGADEAWLIDQVRGKWDILETEDMLLAMQADPLWGRAQEVVVENKADGRALLTTLKAKIPTLVPYDPGSRQKLQRWQAVLGYWKAGRIHIPDPSLPRTAPWIEEFKREHYLGLGAPHNDQLDTSAMGIHYMLSRAQDNTDPWAGWFD